MSSKLHHGDLNFDCEAGGAQPSRQAAIESAPQIPRQLGDLRDMDSKSIFFAQEFLG